MSNHPLNPAILCMDSACKHNSGGGYYGVCNHPMLETPQYFGGVDRIYRETCDLKEVPAK